MAHSFDRRVRVADLLKHSLSKLILEESRDPRFAFVSISSVELMKDYSSAKVYVTLLNDTDKKAIIKALNKASGYFRSELARTINLRTTPKLHFYYDETISKGLRIMQLLEKKE